MSAKRPTSPLIAPVIALLVWLFFWTVITFVIGMTLQVHFWIVFPLLGAIHGIVGGAVFAVCLICERTGRRSWLRGASYGGLAGVVAFAALWLLSYSSVYILCAFPLDVFLSRLLQQRIVRDDARAV